MSKKNTTTTEELWAELRIEKKSWIKGWKMLGERDRDVDEARRWRRRTEELSWPLAMQRVEPALTRALQG